MLVPFKRIGGPGRLLTIGPASRVGEGIWSGANASLDHPGANVFLCLICVSNAIDMDQRMSKKARPALRERVSETVFPT